MLDIMSGTDSPSHEHSVLSGDQVILRLATEADAGALVRIRATPEVHERWGGDDLQADVAESLADEETDVFVILNPPDTVVGMIQSYEEPDPQYRHAGIDIFVDPARHGEGLGTDAVRTLVRHLIEDRKHHRLTIDPAADNAAAIHVYRRVGFQVVGTMRQYERSPDGTWNDGLLMELLADDWRAS